LKDASRPTAARARSPAWSGVLTAPLSAAIPVRWRPVAVTAIKSAHTAIFFSIGGLILLFAWDGIRQRPARRTVVSLGIALAETAIYASNNQVCPLTPLVEELGAERRSVADTFLPDWFSRRIPQFAGTILVLGLVLNLRTVLRGRPR
jgi:hypothetical protein